MKCDHGILAWRSFASASLIAIVTAWTPIEANAQLLYSFENGLQNFASDVATLNTSMTLGVTNGAQSMLIDNLTSGFKFSGTATHGAGSGPEYNTWAGAGNAIAAGKKSVKLQFDFSWDNSALAAAAFAQLGMHVNSNGPGWLQYGTGELIVGDIGPGGTGFPTLAPAAIADGVTMTNLSPNSVHLAIPLGLPRRLHIGPENGNFYQIGFHTNGNWAETVDWAIDNVRITGAVAPTTSETLFSWETPDNPGTPAVDERFEGWEPGNFDGHPPHVQSIVTTGATDGTHALQIDRTTNPTGFTFGSLFVLNSDTNPDPMVEEIDPVIQSRIDNLITKVEAADRLAFDVTYQHVDRFPLPNPTFTDFEVHFTDETGIFYQADGNNINVVAATSPTTTTIEIPLADFVDADTMLTLKGNGLMDGSSFFRIGLATNTDGGEIYQIDNFRLLTDLLLFGDYNDDGLVDAADYVVWRDNVGTTTVLPNDAVDGTIGTGQYDQWKANFGKILGGESASGGALGSSAVPEPTSAALAIALAFTGLLTVRRGV